MPARGAPFAGSLGAPAERPPSGHRRGTLGSQFSSPQLPRSQRAGESVYIASEIVPRPNSARASVCTAGVFSTTSSSRRLRAYS